VRHRAAWTCVSLSGFLNTAWHLSSIIEERCCKSLVRFSWFAQWEGASFKVQRYKTLDSGCSDAYPLSASPGFMCRGRQYLTIEEALCALPSPCFASCNRPHYVHEKAGQFQTCSSIEAHMRPKVNSHIVQIPCGPREYGPGRGVEHVRQDVHSPRVLPDSCAPQRC
jgi:hypothetical protein